MLSKIGRLNYQLMRDHKTSFNKGGSLKNGSFLKDYLYPISFYWEHISGMLVLMEWSPAKKSPKVLSSWSECIDQKKILSPLEHDRGFYEYIYEHSIPQNCNKATVPL